MSTISLDYNPAPGGTRLASVSDDTGRAVTCYSDAGRTVVVPLPVTLPTGGATYYLATVSSGWCATVTGVSDGRLVGTASGTAATNPVTLILRDPPGDDVLSGVIDGGTP